MERDRVELYVDKAGQHRWRYRRRNGRVLADSAEGYARRAGALAGAQTVIGGVEVAGVDFVDVDA